MGDKRDPGNKSSLKRFPIRTVAARTGVNPVTLRAWERRYGLIEPERTAKGHRLYSEGQIALINQVMVYVRDGIAISQVKKLLEAIDLQEPTKVVAELVELYPPRIDSHIPSESKAQSWDYYCERMIAAVNRFCEATMETVYNEALSIYPMEAVVDRLMVPTLEMVARDWNDDPEAVAREHFFRVYLRNKVGARYHHAGHGTGTSDYRANTRLITACLPGEQHELGLLLFALNLRARGYDLVQLGADTPFPAIQAVVDQVHPDAVVLSGAIGHDLQTLAPGLSDLAQRLPVMVGGAICSSHERPLRDLGVVVLGSQIPSALTVLESVVPARYSRRD